MKAHVLMLRSFLLVLAYAGLFPAAAQDARTPKGAFDFPYDVREPTQAWGLPMYLEEISALSWDANRNMLVALQDESGNVFYIKDGQVVEELIFWKDGDYEGIEVVGEDVFALKSSGTIYHIRKIGTDEQTVEKYNDFLNSDYDVEGLGYDPAINSLLLACKGKAGEGKEFDLKKAVYAFDLDYSSLALRPDPIYLVSLKDVQDYLNISTSIRKWEKLMEFFQPNESTFTFSPSGIAVSPGGEHVYILSTAGKFILVLDRKSGEILHIEKLPKKMHRQPEGICFDPLGNLYISNEGKGSVPLLYRYAPRAD